MKYCFILTSLLFIGSCKKNSNERKDMELPAITMTSPTANQVFSGGQIVGIAATITDNTALREVHLEIINNNTGTLLTHEHYIPGGPSYILSRTFTVQAATSYKLKVEAVDGNGNEAKAETTISAN